MNKKPYGMIAALPTPMNNNGDIDYASYEKLIEHVISGGIHGVLVGGSGGEYSLMSFEERKEIIKFVTEKVNGRVHVMAGTGCHRTTDAIQLTQYAEEVGADFALVLHPYYIPTSDEGILAYYQAIADKTNIGLVIYHYPEATGIELSPEVLAEISKLDQVVGIKNTADGIHTSKLLELVKNDETFALLNGYEDLFLPTLAIGGEGAIGIAPNLVPDKVAKIYELVKNNDIQQAIAINKQLLPLFNIIEEDVIPGTVKAGLKALGIFDTTTCREPLTSPSKEYEQKIAQLLESLN
jgi:4-hydroxy-tetrahydrodipicolinate synthase